MTALGATEEKSVGSLWLLSLCEDQNQDIQDPGNWMPSSSCVPKARSLSFFHLFSLSLSLSLCRVSRSAALFGGHWPGCRRQGALQAEPQPPKSAFLQKAGSHPCRPAPRRLTASASLLQALEPCEKALEWRGRESSEHCESGERQLVASHEGD